MLGDQLELGFSIDLTLVFCQHPRLWHCIEHFNLGAHQVRLKGEPSLNILYFMPRGANTKKNLMMTVVKVLYLYILCQEC